MRVLSLAAALCFCSASCLAAETMCYERSYDAAHMQKHKLQEVTKMQLTVLQDGEAVSGQIKASFKELPDFLSSDVTCTIKQKTTRCLVDGDGGSFSFVATVKGIKITNTSKIRFGGEDDGVSVGSEAEHKEFFLFKTTCKK